MQKKKIDIKIKEQEKKASSLPKITQSAKLFPTNQKQIMLKTIKPAETKKDHVITLKPLLVSNSLLGKSKRNSYAQTEDMFFKMLQIKPGLTTTFLT